MRLMPQRQSFDAPRTSVIVRWNRESTKPVRPRRMRPLAPDRSRLNDRAVAPEGSPDACLYLVGEVPGRREPETGRPFVGLAGKALRDMMREAGIDASQVRLANAVPFRPVERSSRGAFRNRKPTAKELRTCGRFVLRDIADVQPRVIGALGKSAAMLFGGSVRVEQCRKRTFHFRNIPVRVTYHLAFVLRFGGKGSALWRSAVADLKRLWKNARQSHRGPRSDPLRPYDRLL
jgi:DNA polymerase